MNIVEKIDDRVSIDHVLVSVFDKQALETLIPGLLAVNPQTRFYSTGGTYRALQAILADQATEHLIQVSDYTGQPEMQGGLVKTLDFKIYLGLLSETYNEAHLADLERVQGVAFDMVVVNLYPFSQVIAEPDCTPETARANIDIGGPCMVRASAKNFIRVVPVVDPSDYNQLLGELQTQKGTLSLATRFHLARKAFAHTAEYDKRIAAYLEKRNIDQISACYTINTP
jgi:phosphoribosylaminoimidazolecarboxamide formyltransferase/IMP cyclohydrolase